VLAGAAALVQMSRRESLSLAALEAWAQAVPVIADGNCAVLAGHLERGVGGRSVSDFESFTAALDELWEHPERWQALGRQGQDYVQRNYGSGEVFAGSLEEALRSLTEPLAECMRRRGKQRAAKHCRPLWRERFARLVEEWLHAPVRAFHEEVEVQPRGRGRTVSAGLETLLLPVRVVNRGSHAVMSDGPTRVVVRCRVVEEAGATCVTPCETPLPGLLMPGRALAIAVRVPVPSTPGSYQIVLRAERAEAGSMEVPLQTVEARVSLVVEAVGCSGPPRSCSPLLEAVQAALAPAERLQRLPDDYVDVTEGWLAGLKRRVKRKLLNNFKRAYVDVALRQQSAFNQHVLAALHELSEWCATLDHALHDPGVLAPRSRDRSDARLEAVNERLAESQRRCAALEERLARLETRLLQEVEVSS
jgi:hypothetical protein